MVSKISVALMTFALCGAFTTPASAASLRAGAAVTDITPTNLPIRTAGNLTLTVVGKIADPLHARAGAG